LLLFAPIAADAAHHARKRYITALRALKEKEPQLKQLLKKAEQAQAQRANVQDLARKAQLLKYAEGRLGMAQEQHEGHIHEQSTVGLENALRLLASAAAAKPKDSAQQLLAKARDMLDGAAATAAAAQRAARGKGLSIASAKEQIAQRKWKAAALGAVYGTKIPFQQERHLMLLAEATLPAGTMQRQDDGGDDDDNQDHCGGRGGGGGGGGGGSGGGGGCGSGAEKRRRSAWERRPAASELQRAVDAVTRDVVRIYFRSLLSVHSVSIIPSVDP